MVNINPSDQVILRRATNDDFDDIYTIWMQDHVLPHMNFEYLPKEQFKPIYADLMKQSEIYVIECKGQAIATRRIIPCRGEYKHSVSLASFGVHKDYLGSGYGKQFYNFLIEKIKTEKPYVKRIEIWQVSDNDIAFKLSQKMDFKAEVIFPDSLRRQTGPKKYTSKWYMGIRFLAFMLDPVLTKQTKSHVKIYVPKMPLLKPDESLMHDAKVVIDQEHKKAICSYRDNIIGVCTFAQGVRRFSHIQFWEIKLEPGCDLSAMEACLRQLACQAAQHCKKIEMYVADKVTAALLEMLGFHCRGSKTASRKIGDDYCDEIGVDLSFFNIQDASEFLHTLTMDKHLVKRMLSALNKCQKSILRAHSEKQLDQYSVLYLENMVFQMIREGLGEIAMRRYGQKDQEPPPWHKLIHQLPSSLKEDFIRLEKLISNTCVNEPTQQSSSSAVNC